MNSQHKISLCITSYNRLEMTLRSFAKVIDDPRISEILILDDGSEPGIAKALKEKIRPIENVSFFGASVNEGVYRAKKNAMTLAFSEWCILLDSDNVIGPDYIDRLYQVPQWDTQTSYLPDFAQPTFDYRHFGGVVLTKENVAQYLDQKMFDCLINTMNGFYNRTEYLSAWDIGVEPGTSDSMFMNYKFLEMGNKLEVLSGLSYEHTIHDGSHYKQHSHKNVAFRDELNSKYKSLH